MKRRDLLAGLGGVTAAGSLLVGSGAFTSVEAEREFDVNIVDEDEDPLGALVTEDRWTMTSYDIKPSVDVFESGPTAVLGENNGIAHINNSLSGEVVALLDASQDYIECQPCDEGGDSITISGGDQADFEAFVDCSESDNIEDVVDIVARINPDNEEAVSADIDDDVELEFDTYVTVDLDPSSGRVRLATSHDQHGEHLNIELPLEIKPFWANSESEGEEGKAVEIESLSGFDCEVLASESDKYDTLHKLELFDASGAEYEIENWLTYHSEEDGSGWWEHHGTSEVQAI